MCPRILANSSMKPARPVFEKVGIARVQADSGADTRAGMAVVMLISRFPFGEVDAYHQTRCMAR